MARGVRMALFLLPLEKDKREATIGYNGYVGWQQIPTKIDVLNLQEYATHRNTLADLGLISYNNNYVRPDLLGKGTDWQEELFNTALMHNHNLYGFGRNRKNTYNLSGGFANQDGNKLRVQDLKGWNFNGDIRLASKKLFKSGS